MSSLDNLGDTARRLRALSPEAMRAGVLEAWQTVLPEADENGSFLDQGGSSLTAVLLVTQLEELSGLIVPFSVLVTASGVDDLVNWFVEQMQGQNQGGDR